MTFQDCLIEHLLNKSDFHIQLPYVQNTSMFQLTIRVGLGVF